MKNISIIIVVLIPAFIFSVRTTSGQAIRISVPGDHATIQAAIDAANEGDTVLVSDGTYYENIKIYSKSIILASHFILDGDEEHISNTIIDGSAPVYPDSASVIIVRSCTGSGPLIKGFTITGGAGTKASTPYGSMIQGGGITSIYSGVTIEQNIITGNVVSDPSYYTGGGGILAVTGLPEQQVIIRKNTINDNHIQSSTYSQGAGIFLAEPYGLKLVENNNIFENTATCTGIYKANGGGIQLHTREPWATPIIVRNNRIANNEIHCVASHGGGIFLSFPPGGSDEPWGGKAQIEIYNNLIVDNYSEDRGGGISVWDQTYRAIFVTDPNPIICNNTLVNNTAREGGAIYNFDMNVLLFNNIFWNHANEGNACEISMEDTDYPAYSWPNDGVVQCMYNIVRGGYPGNGNISEAPTWISNSYDPDSQSDCIGTGIGSISINRIKYDAPSTDYYGNPRPNPVDRHVDIGAIETSFMLTGIKSPALHYFQLFPNPADDHVILLAGDYGKYTLELYTSGGQLLRKRDFTGTSCTLDLTDCNKGLYILMVRTQAKVWTGKIVRE